MNKKSKQTPKAWVEIFQGQRKEFPQGCAITRIIPDKTKYSRKLKHKQKGWD